MKIVISNDQYLPRNSQTTKATTMFAQEWPIGELFTYDLLVRPKPGTNATIFSEELFDILHDLSTDIESTGQFTKEHLLSIAGLGGTELEQGYAAWLLKKKEIAYTYICHELTNENATGTRMQMAATLDPNRDVSLVPLAIRPVIENYTNTTRFDFFLTNRLVDVFDAVREAMALFPFVLPTTAAVIAVIIAIVFQSVLLPFRMLITIALTLLWTYGTVSALFCTTWFYWLSKNIEDQPGLCWIVPILSFSMLVGLGLDYDIFLFMRINEYRKQGWNTRAAVIKGVSHTGHIITFAGIIMAIAFSGLLLSGEMLLNQFGLLLLLDVLLDTFVIRTLLNPAIIFLLGDANFWPIRNPTKFSDPTQLYEDTNVTEHRPLLAGGKPSVQ